MNLRPPPLSVSLAGLVAGSLLSFGVLEALVGEWRGVSEALHSTVEATGGVAMVIMAVFLLQRQQEDYRGKLFLLALGFLSMGLLDLFHAATVPGKGFILLHNVASFAGGIWFALTWAPGRAFAGEAVWKSRLPWLVVVAALIFGVWTLVARETLPAMVREGEFTPVAQALNLLAGAFFAAAATRLYLDFLRFDKPEIYLFACIATLFGVANLLFPFSALWDNTWWLWHLLCLSACLLALALVVHQHQRTQGTLARLVKELQRSNAELEQFAYVASHDLQEPLRMVSSYTQLLARRYRGRLDADADEFIAYAVDGATRMQQLINDLLAFSRVSTRGSPFAPTDAEAALVQALANLRAALEESQAMVTHDPLPTVRADASQLVQLLQNLIGNALKFRGAAPPQIHIAAQQMKELPVPGAKAQEGWAFSVRDNGIGIDPEYHERIFVLFQRLHTKAEYPGTGIGLAICKRIAERHGGRIWLESAPGRGATFYFTLPAQNP